MTILKINCLESTSELLFLIQLLIHIRYLFVLNEDETCFFIPFVTGFSSFPKRILKSAVLKVVLFPRDFQSVAPVVCVCFLLP